MLGHMRRVQQLVSLRQFTDASLGVQTPALVALYGSLAGTALHAADHQPAALAPSPSTPQQQPAAVPVERQRLLQVSVVGVPNAGKSTLTNALVGQKVSAVSPKTNTTVHSRLGAFTEGESQVVVYDTPGVVGRRHYMNPRHERRVKSAWVVAGDCDLLLFIVDGQRQLELPDPRVTQLVEDFGRGTGLGLPDDWQPPPAVLVMNKVDAVPRSHRSSLLALADRLRGLSAFQDVFWISALQRHGVDELRQYLLERATPGEWTVDPESASDRNDEEMALELVREQIFLRFYKELPYELQVQPVAFRPCPDGALYIEHNVMVRNEGMKKIVVGRNGAAIGTVGRSARLELEQMWQRRVHLILRVKISSE